MESLIRKILKEETSKFSKFELSTFKTIDRVGIEKFIDEYLRHMGLTLDEEENLVWEYFSGYGGGCDEYVNFVFEADEISNMFEDGDYDIQNMVKRFLEDDYDYVYDGYECYYDEYQLDDINEENMKNIIKIYESQKEEDETLKDFIKRSELENIIGCAYTDAQQSADIRALHDDFLDGVHEVTEKIQGKWDWKTHTLKGSISICELMYHEDAFEIIADSLQHGYRWADIVDSIVEREWEDVWNGNEGDVLFGEPVTIDGYKHFRYGGGCDEYVNFVFEADEISNMFEDGDYDIQNMVKRFLEDDYDYVYDGYECYYDEYQLDDINEENMKNIIKIYESQKEEDETLKDFIKRSELENIIGCAYTDAQQSADIRALHDDFLDGVHEVTEKIQGKWDWKTHTLKGSISICELMYHEDAFEIIADSLQHGYRWADIVDSIVEREWEDVWNGNEGDVLFGEPVTIDGYKHFRYGGAGTLDTKEFNEYLYNRLYDEYSFFM